MSLILRTEGRVRVVLIDRPAVRNAVDPALARALYDAFLAFERDDSVDCAVLSGTGGAFCAGFDLRAAADGSGARWIETLGIDSGWTDPVGVPRPGPMGPSRLFLSKPVIAAVEGWAAAGGLELALWADMRVAARDAQFGVLCRRWGVPLIDGGTVRLPRVVGQGRANDLILTGRAIDAEVAERIGLVDRVTDPGAALVTAIGIAQDLTRFPQATMRADLVSARLAPAALAAALVREWRSVETFGTAGAEGAQRFAKGAGRGGAWPE